MMATMCAIINPRDEVVIFEPFYEKLRAGRCCCPARRRASSSCREPDWSFDEKGAREGPSNQRTKAIVINTAEQPDRQGLPPRAELEYIAKLCRKWNTLAITDEVYEHILYEGGHVSMASLDGMAERTITTSSLSKTFCITGWRLGYAIAP